MAFELELANDDGVVIELDRSDPANPMICVSFPAYLLNAPRKDPAPRETKKDSGIYTIPKSATFAYAVKKFKAPLEPAVYADGAFRMSLNVGRKLSDRRRKEIYDAAVERGLKISAADADEIAGEHVGSSPAVQLRANRTKLG